MSELVRSDVITPSAAAAVLWCYGRTGARPSDHDAQMVSRITRANQAGRRVLAHAEPALVAAVDLVQRNAYGVSDLREIAGQAALNQAEAVA